MHLILFAGLVCTALTSAVIAESVYDALQRDPDLSEFARLISRDEVVSLLTRSRSAMVFAPTNDALARTRMFSPELEDKLASYHVGTRLVKKENFPKTVPTYLSGAPSLYLTTRYNELTDEKEYFVNNAKVLREMEFTVGNSRQLMYVIDECLRPYAPNTDLPPDALEFVSQPAIYNMQENLGPFAARVRLVSQEEIFQRIGNHTFFMPIASASNQNLNQMKNVDDMVIRGHVIPNHVLFIRTMGSEPYHSEAYTPQLKVEISLINQTLADGNNFVMYAQSNTIQSDPQHRKGVVISRIIKPNIPVRNGVVHLIEKPLMIIDTTIWEFIIRESDGRLARFADLVNHAPVFENLLKQHGTQREMTVFAPNDEAIERLGAENVRDLKQNQTLLEDLLKLHLLDRSISSDDARNGNYDDAPLSADARRSLYLRVIGDERNKTLTVEGGGVNATATQADIGATDGIIHIIDRVLGMPYFTIFEKMKEDPLLNDTFILGEQEEWSHQLGAINQKFTFFAPSNQAWKRMRAEMPSEYKQLHMGTFSYHVKKILDRHLIVGRELKLQQLLDPRWATIKTVEGTIKVNNDCTAGKLCIQWEDIQARIVRPDVQATNGVIHVIDHVMMKARDMTTTGGVESLATTFPLLLLCLFGSSLRN